MTGGSKRFEPDEKGNVLIQRGTNYFLDISENTVTKNNPNFMQKVVPAGKIVTEGGKTILKFRIKEKDLLRIKDRAVTIYGAMMGFLPKDSDELHITVENDLFILTKQQAYTIGEFWYNSFNGRNVFSIPFARLKPYACS